MLQLEMKLDNEMIVRENQYTPAYIYETLDASFAKYGFQKTVYDDGTICYRGNGKPSDYGAFGLLITTLKDKPWFLPYATKWLWYNSDDGEDENDYAVEDALQFFAHRASVA